MDTGRDSIFVGVCILRAVTVIVKLLMRRREYESIVSLSSPGGTVTPSGISSRMRRDSAKYSVRQLHGMRMNGEEAVLLTERNLDFAVPRCHETHCKLRSPSGLFS
ncbi:hypothetical protein PMIN04_012145 [Paraphaeosphaeria minitans]